jgi:hypothetical protein
MKHAAYSPEERKEHGIFDGLVHRRYLTIVAKRVGG